MQEPFTFQGAKKIVFGQGSIRTLPEEIHALSAKRALIVMDQGLAALGMAQRVTPLLEAQGLAWTLFDEVTPEPAPELADAGAEAARKEGCDVVLGIGGGSSLDVAKAAAMLVKNGGKAQDYIGLDTVSRPGLPTVMVPTTAGTGSEVTFTAVFTMRNDKKKGGINSRFLYPDVALLDPDLTLTLPPEPTATTGTDALTHAIEAFTSLQANALSDLAARESIRLIGTALEKAVHQGKDTKPRRDMLLASLLGGMALAGAGVGACHALAYPLGAFFDIPHGLANAVLLPYIMEFNLAHASEKYAQIALLMREDLPGASGAGSGEAAVKRIRELTRKIGIPQRLSELNIPEDSLKDMAAMAMTVARPLANNPRKVSLADAVEIYRKAL
ncbi:MAG: iron-containing alcohol dehydrogenase [Deltaproteobacteria bacterium]|nr:iron-containing alcohol dehydrogenase [Deltaproteobacteria bacterium]